MAKSKDMILIQMREAASAKGLQKDLPGVLSLFSSVEHWAKNNTGVCTDFVKTVFIKSNYRLSFELLSEQCNCGEKTLRNRCKKYIAYYEDKRRYYEVLPLSMLVIKYIEFYYYSPDRVIISEYYDFDIKSLPEVINAFNTTPEEKELSLRIYLRYIGEKGEDKPDINTDNRDIQRTGKVTTI